MEFHPLANVFPMMSEEEYAELKADIKQNGLRTPIYRYQGSILDGRNRWKACQELGIIPDFQDYGGDSPLSFVISLNLHRRHLSAGQRAAVALDILPFIEEEAKQRMVDAHANPASENLHELGRSDEAAGKQVGVSGRSVAEVKKIREEHPEKFEQIKSGEKSIYEVSREIQNIHVSDGTDDWYTPPLVIESARFVMGSINLDPATSEFAQKWILADKYYTKQDNGLMFAWRGNVWLNPPYSMPDISDFISKIINEYENNNVLQAIVLTNNSTDTKWFQQLSKYPMCLTRGRLSFVNADGKTLAARQGQAIFYLGNNIDRFASEFSKHGDIFVRYDYKK